MSGVVQHASNTATFSSGTSGTATASFTSNTTAGNSLVAIFSFDSVGMTPAVSSVTTNGSAESWTLAKTDGNGYAWIYVNTSTAGGQKVIDINMTWSGTPALSTTCTAVMMVDIFEVNGPISATDKTNTANATITPWSSGATGTLSTASEIVFGVGFVEVESLGTTGSITGPTTGGWTNYTAESTYFQASGSGAGYEQHLYQVVGYQVVSATTSLTYAGTSTPTGAASQYNTGIIAAFEISTGITGTGSLALGSLKFSGTGATYTNATGTGSMALGPLKFSGTGSINYIQTINGLAAGVSVQAPPVNKTDLDGGPSLPVSTSDYDGGTSLTTGSSDVDGGSSPGLITNTTAVATTVPPAAVAAQAYVGTALALSIVNGQVAQVTAAAPMGTVSSSLAGPVATVAASAPPGSSGSAVAGLVASVTAVALVKAPASAVAGTVAAVSVRAYAGTDTTVEAGPVAQVSVAAPMGTVGVKLPGPVPPNIPVAALPGSAKIAATEGPAQVTVAARLGTVSVTLPGPVAAVAVHAPTGSPGPTMSSIAAAVSARAIAGTVSTPINGQVARASASAPPGAPHTSVSAPNAGVTCTAYIGTVRTTVSAPVAAVNAQAYPNVPKVSLPGPVAGVTVAPHVGTTMSAPPSLVAACTVSPHPGTVKVSITGHTANVILVAPLPPFAGGIYPVSATATIGFKAWGSRRVPVEFSGGVVNTMNVPYSP